MFLGPWITNHHAIFGWGQVNIYTSVTPRMRPCCDRTANC